MFANHRDAALAAPATLNRLELSNTKRTRCHKLPHDPQEIEACLLKLGVRCLTKHAREIVVDLDAMGHLLHGTQEGRHFNAYYGDYCYLPLYVFVGDVPLWAQLRTSDHEAAHGVVPALEKIVAAIRQRCKRARIILRGDSGFCREEILAWCEAHRVHYCLGLQKNRVLIEKLQPALADARARRCLSGAESTRVFTEFEYQTRKSWSRSRRGIGKAEGMSAGDNPRFIVTNLRGPVEHASPGQQPTAVVAGDLGVSAGGAGARLGLGRHRTGLGHRRHGTLEDLKGGRAGERECATGVCALEQLLSLASVVWPVPSTIDGLLTGQRLRPLKSHSTLQWRAPVAPRQRCAQNRPKTTFPDLESTNNGSAPARFGKSLAFMRS